MSAEHHLVAEAEAWLRDHRPHVINHLESAMKYLEDLISHQKTLVSGKEAAEARADTTEKSLADLQAQVASDEDKAKAALDALTASEQGSTASTPTSVNDVVAAAVPQADPAHIAVAVDAHDAAMTAGASPSDQVAAANSAAVQAGADPATAAAIANAITQPSGGTTASADNSSPGSLLPGQVPQSV